MIPSIFPLWLVAVLAVAGSTALLATYRSPVRHASEFRLSRMALLLSGWLLILVPAELFILALPPTHLSQAGFLFLLLLPYLSSSLFSRRWRQQRSRSSSSPVA